MKIVFLTNLVNHHQIPVADELYKLIGDDYTYVAMEQLPGWLKKGGYSDTERPYILRYADNLGEIRNLVNDADVVIIGSAPEWLVTQRIKENKLTFHYSERWFKKISYHLLSPRLWMSLWLNHVRFRNKRSYMLCASAFTATDVHKVFAYPNKCFKWGYFTKVEDFDIKTLLKAKRSDTIRIMWCARFLDLKHPELAIMLAEQLKRMSYNFVIDMFGSGVELERTKELAKSLDVVDVVKFRGNMPNEEILKQLREHDIFIFTSDRNEGWGAVANEAMSNGCAFVGSDKIGSVPFLVKDGVNGLVFKSGDLKDLTCKVKLLIENQSLREKLSKSAYQTMQNEWSPQVAAKRFIELCGSLMLGNDVAFNDGPCSKM